MTVHIPTIENRWQTISDIWRENQWLYIIGGFFLGLLAYPALNGMIHDLIGLLGNLVPEAIGIMFTVAILDQLAQRREEQRKHDELKTRLIREAGSPAHAVALHAIRELRNFGWLIGKHSILQKADLFHADLHSADLYKANLQRTNLKRANFQNALLRYADFEGAHMEETDLRGADLRRANLKHVTMLYVLFDEKTVLPDAVVLEVTEEGKRIYDKYWTSDTDMTRYTNPNHPDFWQPEWAQVGYENSPQWWQAGATRPEHNDPD